MHRCALLLAVAVAIAVGCAGIALAHTIKHIIVLEFENRAPGHIWGPSSRYADVFGTKGFCNPIDVDDASRGKVCVTDDAPLDPRDPNHNYDSIGMICKCLTYHDAMARLKTGNYTGAVATMQGFVDCERRRGEGHGAAFDFSDVMQSMPPEDSPVLTALAGNFSLFSNARASGPIPTTPNRLFAHLGTSGGLTETSDFFYGANHTGGGTDGAALGELYPQRSIFSQVRDAGLDARVYYEDVPWETLIADIALNPEIVQPLEQFYADARLGKLPNYAWINPRAGVNLTTRESSDCAHPSHDYSLFEKLARNVYTALRNSPAWNDTVFVILTDESGAFVSTRPPVFDIPSPGDGIASWPDANFKFDVSGVQIPFLVVSPWVDAGMLYDELPPAAKPAHNSLIEQTSLMATVRALLNISEGPLTQRDAWAARFDFALSQRTAPRTDCPTELPLPHAPAPNSYFHPARGYDALNEPVTGLQRDIAAIHGRVARADHRRHLGSQVDLAQFLDRSYRRHRHETLRWKASKVHAKGHSAGSERAAMKKRRHYTEHYAPRHDAVTAVAIHAHGIDVARYTLICAAKIELGLKHPKYVMRKFMLSWQSLPHRTIALELPSSSTKAPAASQTEWYCLTASGFEKDATVGLALCYPSRVLSRDKLQQWIWRNDSIVESVAAPGLCLASTCLQATRDAATGKTMMHAAPVTLQPCDPTSILQRLSYEDFLNNNNFVTPSTEGYIGFGNAMMDLAAVRVS